MKKKWVEDGCEVNIGQSEWDVTSEDRKSHSRGSAFPEQEARRVSKSRSRTGHGIRKCGGPKEPGR